MKPTMEILAGLQKNSTENADEIFTRLFRYLLRSDIYFVAYKNLYSNSGAGTRGINNDTADGFGEEKIQKSSNLCGAKATDRTPSDEPTFRKRTVKNADL